ncbi:IclR family transcriptional regulator [Geodermatophilus sp. CPCC 205761]|uniref:IclR family transcriptional regulator n=1 Tax=Geodermatophilus sp. CPCC 205761 TaxID=2936597 RepID=UPI003EEEFD3C
MLDAIGAAPAGLSATEVSRRTGMPLSTAHRLVQTLAAWGGLERQPDGRYRAGLRLWEVAASAPRASGLRDTARPFLEDLYEATQQNVQLAVLDSGAALVVEHFATRVAVPTASRIGGRLPLHASGVGQVLLAFAPREEQDAVLAGSAGALHRPDDHLAEVLRRVLAGIRRTGVAVAASTMPLPALAVAAPVVGRGGQVVAALAVVLPTEETSGPAYVPAVVATARGVSLQLAGAPMTLPGRAATGAARRVDGGTARGR